MVPDEKGLRKEAFFACAEKTLDQTGRYLVNVVW
jgi:hypothetical protein